MVQGDFLPFWIVRLVILLGMFFLSNRHIQLYCFLLISCIVFFDCNRMLILDYIVGDIAYNKLRLKGFYDEKNKKVKSINNYSNLENYLKENCATDCKYFILKKVEEKDEE